MNPRLEPSNLASYRLTRSELLWDSLISIVIINSVQYRQSTPPKGMKKIEVLDFHNNALVELPNLGKDLESGVILDNLEEMNLPKYSNVPKGSSLLYLESESIIWIGFQKRPIPNGSLHAECARIGPNAPHHDLSSAIDRARLVLQIKIGFIIVSRCRRLIEPRGRGRGSALQLWYVTPQNGTQKRGWILHRLSNGSSGGASTSREIMLHFVTDFYHPSFWFSVIAERVSKISQDLIKSCCNSIPYITF